MDSTIRFSAGALLDTWDRDLGQIGVRTTEIELELYFRGHIGVLDKFGDCDVGLQFYFRTVKPILGQFCRFSRGVLFEDQYLSRMV